MKLRLILILNVIGLFVTNSVFALDNCSLAFSYKSKGWIVHNSSEFTIIEKNVLYRLNKGLAENSIVLDLSGLIITHQTPSGEPVVLQATMYDDLMTAKDEMYGDIAILEVQYQPGVRAEIRWYERERKHIVFNSDILTCLSEAPPFADNSVL